MIARLIEISVRNKFMVLLLTGILVAAGQLAARGCEWIATLDINPLIYGPDGFHAVDALLLLRDPPGRS